MTLSKRQIEACDLLAEGLTYKEIGKRMGVKERTIKAHIGVVLMKLQMRRVQLASYWACPLFQEGLRAFRYIPNHEIN